MNDTQKQAKIAELQARVETKKMLAEVVKLDAPIYDRAGALRALADDLIQITDELQKIAEGGE